MATTSEGNGSRRYGTTNVAPVLRRDYGLADFSYRQLLRLIVEGRVPAKKGIDGRWYFDESDLAAVAEALRPRAS